MEENVWGDSFSPTLNSGIDSNGVNIHNSVLTNTVSINNENINNEALPQHLDKLVSSNQGQRQSAYLDDINENINKKLAGIHLYNDYYHGDKESPLDIKLTLDHNTDDDLNNDTYSFKDFDKFDFNSLQKYQYLEYSDYDIPQILDYLISLPKSHPHFTTYPASLLFQCARYSDHMKKSKSDTESLLFLAFTKITSSVSTTNNLDTATETTIRDTTSNHSSNKSSNKPDTLSNNGADQHTVKKTIDIVTQSYWISSLTYLYYYLTKDESFFKRHPNILQELINTLHTIMIELVTSIHERLTPVIQKTLLNYTTIEEVKETLYRKDWNFFKKIRQAKLAKKREQAKFLQRQNELELKKSLSNSSSATATIDNNTDTVEEETNNSETDNGVMDQNVSDNVSNKKTHSYILDPEILKHLYPPSLEEQMKPSPLKIVQIFGALTYVLNLHQVHPLFQQQCLSIAINWFSTTIFNQILKDKKKKVLSRARAVQIRLNLSTLESWIRNNDISISRPKLIDDFIWERFPFTLIQDLGDIDLNNPLLHNITTFKPVEIDSGKTITDETNSLFYYQTFHQIAFLHLSPVFELLQWLQIATSIESEESLENTISLLPHLTPSQLLKAIDKYNYEVNEHKFNSKLRKHLSKMAKVSTVQQTYLEEKQIPLLCLPTVTELTDCFANDTEIQPFLPDDIQDAIYEIHDTNRKIRINYIEEEREEEADSASNGEKNSENKDNTIDSNLFTIKDNEKVKKSNDGIYSTSSNMITTNNDTIFSNFTAPTTSVAGPSWAFNSATTTGNNNEKVDSNVINDVNYDFETNPW